MFVAVICPRVGVIAISHCSERFYVAPGSAADGDAVYPGVGSRAAKSKLGVVLRFVGRFGRIRGRGPAGEDPRNAARPNLPQSLALAKLTAGDDEPTCESTASDWIPTRYP
jgi:hypothetical protein